MAVIAFAARCRMDPFCEREMISLELTVVRMMSVRVKLVSGAFA